MRLKHYTAIFFVFALLSVVIATAWRSYSRLKPPDQVKTLGAFKSFLPEPRSIVLIDVNGDREIVMFGEQPIALFSEFPAGYLFDAKGRFIDWAVEASDVDSRAEAWEAARESLRNGRSITYAEAMELAKEQRRKGREGKGEGSGADSDARHGHEAD